MTDNIKNAIYQDETDAIFKNNSESIHPVYKSSQLQQNDGIHMVENNFRKDEKNSKTLAELNENLSIDLKSGKRNTNDIIDNERMDEDFDHNNQNSELKNYINESPSLERLLSPVESSSESLLYEEEKEENNKEPIPFNSLKGKLRSVSEDNAVIAQQERRVVIKDTLHEEITFDSKKEMSPINDNNNQEGEAYSSIELLEVLEDTQVPISPVEDSGSFVVEEEDNESAILSSPDLVDKKKHEDRKSVSKKEQKLGASITSVQEKDARESINIELNTHLASYIKPRTSQHSLPNHPILKINRDNPLDLHSKFSLAEPIIDIQYSPNAKLANFSICTSKTVSVWELNKEKWEMIEQFTTKENSEEIFFMVRFTPDGDKLIIAGLFGEVCLFSQSSLLDGEIPNTELSYSYQLRIYELNGETLVPQATVYGSNIRKVEPLLKLKGHKGKFLDILINSHNNTLISSDDQGMVLKYALNQSWTEKEEQMELQGGEELDKGQNTPMKPVISLSPVPVANLEHLVMGFTTNSVILWDCITCRHIQTFQLPNILIQKGKFCFGKLQEPRAGLYTILIFENRLSQDLLTATTSQGRSIKQIGLFIIGNLKCTMCHNYQRKVNVGQSTQLSMTQPTEDNVLTFALSKYSNYILSGSDTGRLLIFNCKTSQNVGVLMDLQGEPVRALAFHEHLPIIAVGGERGTVLIYYQSF
jgi:hypothetical protein